MIKAILFDVDGVLLDSFEANLKFMQDVIVFAGYEPPTRELYRKTFHYNLMDNIKLMTGSDDSKELERIWNIGREKKEVPYPYDLVSMPEGVRTTIKQLARDYKVGIVTSRVRESIFNNPLLADLQEYFIVAVAYQDTERHKPEPAPLLLACEKLGISPDEALYIGDAITDVQAAQSAGMKVLSFPEKLPGADAHLTHFQDLPDLILDIQ
jgi:pyrophosphatase PpaX